MPWEHRGQRRPAFAIEPGPGQESVRDSPRPPRLVADPRRVEVRIGESLLARSSHAIRVLETASPPTFYLPRADVRMELLRRAADHSYCGWKGQATYFDVIGVGRVIERAAWSYEDRTPTFSGAARYLRFYPGGIAGTVDGERMRPQAGAFYGGWVTDGIVGPYKGEAGTGGW